MKLFLKHPVQILPNHRRPLSDHLTVSRSEILPSKAVHICMRNTAQCGAEVGLALISELLGSFHRTVPSSPLVQSFGERAAGGWGSYCLFQRCSLEIRRSWESGYDYGICNTTWFLTQQNFGWQDARSISTCPVSFSRFRGPAWTTRGSCLSLPCLWSGRQALDSHGVCLLFREARVGTRDRHWAREQVHLLGETRQPGEGLRCHPQTSHGPCLADGFTAVHCCSVYHSWQSSYPCLILDASLSGDTRGAVNMRSGAALLQLRLWDICVSLAPSFVFMAFPARRVFFLPSFSFSWM